MNKAIRKKFLALGIYDSTAIINDSGNKVGNLNGKLNISYICREYTSATSAAGVIHTQYHRINSCKFIFKDVFLKSYIGDNMFIENSKLRLYIGNLLKTIDKENNCGFISGQMQIQDDIIEDFMRIYNSGILIQKTDQIKEILKVSKTEIEQPSPIGSSFDVNAFKNEYLGRFVGGQL